MTKVIKITTEQYNRYIFEGVTYTKQDSQYSTAPVDFSINHYTTDKANTGKNSVDTRVFGNKHDILYGDGTNNYINTLNDNYRSVMAAIKFYESIIQYIENGHKGDIYTDEFLNKNTYNNGIDWLNGAADDTYIINTSKRKINDLKLKYEQYSQKVNRVNNAKEDKVARYNTGIVQGTNVKYIALFFFTDFNFSDAIKHGYLRQNPNTDNVLGITADQRLMNGRGTAQIPITYDKQYSPNIPQNFSLDNVQQYHYKQQYGLNGEGGYNSVTQFMDKSIIYAKYALNKEGFKPDYIVSVPSSSKYNEYYCTNLSNKLGVEYVKDFFQRNIVNIKFNNGSDIEDMRKNGFSSAQIIKFATKVKNEAFAEISYLISYNIRQLIYNNQSLFSNIPIKKNSRDKFDLDSVVDCVMRYIYTYTMNNLENSEVNNNNFSKILIQNFKNKSINVKTSSYDAEYLMGWIINIMKKRNIKSLFDETVIQTRNNIMSFIDKIRTEGYVPRWNTQKFKITHFDKAFRPYLKGVYIIADKECNKNGELFSRYKNAKFLIFDEDINSGTSLKLTIDAIENKIPDINSNNLCCLVNAVSNTGKV